VGGEVTHHAHCGGIDTNNWQWFLRYIWSEEVELPVG
jgi:hypothetical protein